MPGDVLKIRFPGSLQPPKNSSSYDETNDTMIIESRDLSIEDDSFFLQYLYNLIFS